MSERPHVGIAGATGAVGKELISILDRVPWRPEELVALARLSSRETSLAWGDGRVGVDSLDEMDFSGLDLLFVALPRPDAPDILRAAHEADVKVVDLSGMASELYGAPVCIPWVNPEGWSPDLRMVSIPEASATLVGSVLAPLKRAGLVERAHATVFAPASV